MNNKENEKVEEAEREGVRGGEFKGEVKTANLNGLVILLFAR